MVHARPCTIADLMCCIGLLCLSNPVSSRSGRSMKHALRVLPAPFEEFDSTTCDTPLTLSMWHACVLTSSLPSLCSHHGGACFAAASQLLSCGLGIYHLGLPGRGASAPSPRVVTTNGVIYSSKVNSISELMYDDDAAAAEAAAAGDRPAYCGDRYFTSLAGGEQICSKFDIK